MADASEGRTKKALIHVQEVLLNELGDLGVHLEEYVTRLKDEKKAVEVTECYQDVAMAGVDTFDVKAAVERAVGEPLEHCSGCEIFMRRGQRKKCGGCGAVYYCGDACKQEHWKYHKEACKKKAGGR